MNEVSLEDGKIHSSAKCKKKKLKNKTALKMYSNFIYQEDYIVDSDGITIKISCH